MISKQYIKDLEFKDIHEFFNYVIESKINGNYRQTKELIGKMSQEQRLAFKLYMDETFTDAKTKQDLFNMLLEA